MSPSSPDCKLASSGRAKRSPGHWDCPADRGAAVDHPAADIPQVLLNPAAHPPPTSTWIPEVHHRALLMLVYDQGFTSVEAYERFTYEPQLRLWASRLHSVLLRWTSTPRLLYSVSQRWAQLRRGTTMRCGRIDDESAIAVLDFPLGLSTRSASSA